MLTKSIRAVLIIAGWLLMTSLGFAQIPRYVSPADRVTLKADIPWPQNSFLAIAYHDVEDGAADPNYLAVRTSALNEQLAWLRENGYHPISVQQILDAHDGKTMLPEKAVLLTFDDGYSSFYTRVWPLLKAYNSPALWAPVGSWIDAPANKAIDFGGLMTPRDKFSTWNVVQQMANSSLVEIGSHTWNLHFGATANPQGSQQPAVANRLFNNKTGKYETEEQYATRINTDITLITHKIASVTGKAPRAWVWPYGAANGTTLNMLKNQGYRMAFTLEDGLANAAELDNIPRLLVAGNPSLTTFATHVTQVRERSTMRVMQIDLDYVYDPNPAQQSKNIDKLIQRVYDMHISHVFLQAYADPKGDGNVRELYFPNRWLPMRADLFNFVAWQLRTRAHVTVYAWMPVLAFNLDASIARVEKWDPSTKSSTVDHKQYLRLSPWSREARKRITDIYEDLAKYGNFQGILFHDDAFLSDFEDVSPDALAAYRAAGFPDNIEHIRNDPQIFERWTRFKSRALIDFTRQLTDAVRNIRGPQVETARNIYAMPVLDPKSEAWYAQNLNDYLETYNWTAPMAMPFMEKISANESNAWLDRLVNSVAKTPGALGKTVFELQARDWRKSGEQDEISGKQLAAWMRQLNVSGAANFGYYPDDFINNQPEMSEVRPVFSSFWYPLK